MYMIARIYSSDEQARAAADAVVAAGYNSNSVAVLAAPSTSAEPGAASPASADDMANAVKVGTMLGSHASFYMAELTEGRTLVVATPPMIASGKAESILNSHNPLPMNHEPVQDEFVAVSDQASPFSNFFGLPVLNHGGPVFSNLFGLKTKSEGVTFLTRSYSPSSSGLFSEKFGMRLSTKSDTPLSSMLGMSTKSKRNEGKSSSFGISFKSKRETPFSSLLGLPLLSKTS